METYYLYLDESGQFKDQDSNSEEVSLVGGILFKQEPQEIIKYIIENNLIKNDENFHSAEKNNPERQLFILKKLKE